MNKTPIVYVVDDDECARDSMRLLLMTVDLQAAVCGSPFEFIEEFDPRRPACVVLDQRMPGMNGIETLLRVREWSNTVPVIFVSGHGDTSTVLHAMKLGAVDFFEKPISTEQVLGSIQHCIQYDVMAHRARRQREVTMARVAKLSNRERQVLDCVLNGMSNKETARHLGVGPKTIEVHRAHLMQKMEVHSVAKLVIQILGTFKIVGNPQVSASFFHQIDPTSYVAGIGGDFSLAGSAVPFRDDR